MRLNDFIDGEIKNDNINKNIMTNNNNINTLIKSDANNWMVDLVIECYKGNYDLLIHICDKLNIKTEYKNDTLYLYGNIISGIFKGLDPMTLYVTIAFVLFGMNWVEILGEGYNKIRNDFSKYIKDRKNSDIDG